MVTVCAVLGCSNVAGKTKEPKSFYRIPAVVLNQRKQTKNYPSADEINGFLACVERT